MDQYDRAKAKILSGLVLGSTRKGHAQFASLVESIVEGEMSSDLLQQLLADLRAKRHLARTPAERAAINGAIADVLDGIFASGGTLPNTDVAPTVEPATVTQPIAERPISKHSQFYGLGLREAAPKVLALVKQPQLPAEIWAVLEGEGFKSAHSNPVHAVNDALRRRAKTHGDVLLVGGGKWGRVDWYNEAELEEIRKSVGGMGGRDKGSHSERTRAGMLVAKERGVRLGATKKLSPEETIEFLDAVRSGASVVELSKRFGISTTSVNNYAKAEGYSMKQLRQEGRAMRKAAAKTKDDSEPEETRH